MTTRRGRPPTCKCTGRPTPTETTPLFCDRCHLKFGAASIRKMSKEEPVPRELTDSEPLMEKPGTPDPYAAELAKKLAERFKMPDDDSSPAGGAAAEEPEPVESTSSSESPAEVIEKGWRPGAEVFLNLRGKLYLPARRRVQWMRGEPVPHPDWTIDTDILEHQRGKFVKPGRVEEGYAVVRANIYDADGRLISTGVKSEYSENFPDYLEKAETGAIARALAIAGYGTESALDLEEGVDKERIADAPVESPLATTGRPISITPATAAPVGRGGAPTLATAPQIRRVSQLSSTLGLGLPGLIGVIDEVLGAPFDEPVEDAPGLVSWMEKQSAGDIGQIIHALEIAKDAVGEATHDDDPVGAR